jgi:hypothetical protein
MIILKIQVFSPEVFGVQEVKRFSEKESMLNLQHFKVVSVPRPHNCSMERDKTSKCLSNIRVYLQNFDEIGQFSG